VPPLFDFVCTTCGKREEKLAKPEETEKGPHLCDGPLPVLPIDQLPPKSYRLGIWRRAPGLPAAAIPPSGRYSYGGR
jgi:hypothetical protein